MQGPVMGVAAADDGAYGWGGEQGQVPDADKQCPSRGVGNMDGTFRSTFPCIEMEPGFSMQQLQVLVLAVRPFLPTQSYRDPDKCGLQQETLLAYPAFQDSNTCVSGPC